MFSVIFTSGQDVFGFIQWQNVCATQKIFTKKTHSPMFNVPLISFYPFINNKIFLDENGENYIMQYFIKAK